ncbi:MAG: DNA polymerase III subunit gamma/tau [Clostridia bacterium]|nr:DNA polymerase III subunit gamma/tau [Clostridia bacterium]
MIKSAEVADFLFAKIKRALYNVCQGEAMEHLALYRKYRPTNFDEVVGQEHITRALKNQIISGNVGHAYLFTGSRGVGKTSIARIFARAVNCQQGENGSPCGKCPTCIGLEKQNSLNIIEIDAASNNRVDDVRELREKVKFLPVDAKYKVYIIDEVHMLTDSAFNALLKTLEEPPAHVIFILATTEAHKLPATILSRCIRFDFRLVGLEALTKHLSNVLSAEGIEADDDALRLIAMAGEGSVRDTLSIADCIVAYSTGKITKESVQNVLGTTDEGLLLEYFDLLKDKNIGGILEFVAQIDAKGKNLSVFVKDMARHARNLLICKTCKNPNDVLGLASDTYEKMKTQADGFDEKSLISYMQSFGGAENELRYTLSPRLLLETLSLAVVSGADALEVKKN